MFNLIMGVVDWNVSRASMPISRVFEHTEAHLIDQLRVNGQVDLAQLMRLPCLLMSEGLETERCQVGRILQARSVGNDIRFEYSLDTEVPALTNSLIFARRDDFDMPSEFEFRRTHWAVKDVDLYQMLMRMVRPRRQRPSVFSIPDHEAVEARLVSVMMPFDAGSRPVYDAISQAAENCGLAARRADEIWEAPGIIQDVVSLIDRARVVVCDLSGRNPNVFYEAGIAHTLGREVIVITQSDHDVPFDLRHLRYIHYHNNNEGHAALTRTLQARMETILGH